MQYLQGLNLIEVDDFNQYKPISCDFYDGIINHAGSKKRVQIHYSDPSGSFIKTGVIEDVFTRNKEEFCLIEGCEIRLDYISSIQPITLAS